MPVKFCLPGTTAANLRPGQKVYVGLRPEHLEIEAGTEPDVQEISMTVDLVEPLGSEALLHCRIGGQPVVAKVNTPVDVQKLSQITRLAIPTAKLHVFDVDTGRAINGRA
jgi:multiple sugar transport system ATP-binding protein